MAERKDEKQNSLGCPACTVGPFAGVNGLVRHLNKFHPGWIEAQGTGVTNGAGRDTGDSLPAEISALIGEEGEAVSPKEKSDQEQARAIVREIVEEVLSEKVTEEPDTPGNKRGSAARPYTLQELEDVVYRGFLRGVTAYEKIADRAGRAAAEIGNSKSISPEPSFSKDLPELIEKEGLMDDEEFEIWAWTENLSREKKNEIERARQWVKKNRPEPAKR